MSTDGSETTWAARVAEVVAGEVKRRRRDRGLTVAQLSAELGAYGVSMAAPVLNKLEQRKRPVVSVAELLALAAVLRVPPLLLLFPVDGDVVVEPVEGRPAHAWEAWRWFEGEGLAWSTDGEPLPPVITEETAGVVALFRSHEGAVAEVARTRVALREAQTVLADVEAGVDRDHDQDQARYSAGYWEREAAKARDALQMVRQQILHRGLNPPPDVEEDA